MKKTFLVFALCLIITLSILPVCAISDGEYSFSLSNGEAVITAFNGTISATVQIPSQLGGCSVTKIGSYAFYRAFYESNRMTSVTVPETVIRIDEYAFADCSHLSTIIIPDSVISINKTAFLNCNSLTIICNENSYAHKFAVENSLKFKLSEAKETPSNIGGCSSALQPSALIICSAFSLLFAFINRKKTY